MAKQNFPMSDWYLNFVHQIVRDVQSKYNPIKFQVHSRNNKFQEIIFDRFRSATTLLDQREDD